jgi:hypothetical protein
MKQLRVKYVGNAPLVPNHPARTAKTIDALTKNPKLMAFYEKYRSHIPNDIVSELDEVVHGSHPIHGAPKP